MNRPETFQSEWELEQLVAVYNQLLPIRVLEIGVWHGGTLWHWLRRGVRVVAVDDEMRRVEDWKRWAAKVDADLYLLQGYSQDQELIAKAAELGPYDFVFIDGDHTYSSVRADWENYGSMIEPGGVVVFHDILPRPSYGVSEVWNELTSQPGARYITICQNEVLPGNEGRMGVGILWV